MKNLFYEHRLMTVKIAELSVIETKRRCDRNLVYIIVFIVKKRPTATRGYPFGVELNKL